jgi:MOSC domain-containing protein
MATVHSLHCYPIKSARGLNPKRVALTELGFANDRGWMLATPDGRFISQRESPRLALLQPTLTAEHLILNAADMPALQLPLRLAGPSRPVKVWSDECLAFDAGDEAARWVSTLIARSCRLVQFDPARERFSDPRWSGPIKAPNRFTDGFPILVIGSGSLEDLNRRLPEPLPMERFRPNLVIDGLKPYEEDRLAELRIGAVTLRLVKPCTRCIITTTDQQSGERRGSEPLQTLKTYRYDSQLRGVNFGQNAVIITGAGESLEVGQTVLVD